MNIRQRAINFHKDDNDCLFAFYAIVVFREFKGGDLILDEINIIIKIKNEYIVILRSAFLEHCNSYIIIDTR